MGGAYTINLVHGVMRQEVHRMLVVVVVVVGIRQEANRIWGQGGVGGGGILNLWGEVNVGGLSIWKSIEHLLPIWQEI
jgi:hypothetical protein